LDVEDAQLGAIFGDHLHASIGHSPAAANVQRREVAREGGRGAHRLIRQRVDVGQREESQPGEEIRLQNATDRLFLPCEFGKKGEDGGVHHFPASGEVQADERALMMR